ncbi:hypothetical protein H5410_056007 [Solanum commersonii]|uniref:Uncharacterized protein n=1 Tax=Solanum commersonii TaxID=4109 RepID=A0A9J5WJ42_SOLCO|nr:hypothetical protein H5410_056007 [Solanum commersonii]
MHSAIHPFGLLNCLSTFTFSIFAFWIIGRYSTALRKCSTMRQMLFFIADLIFSFREQLTGTLGELTSIQRLIESMLCLSTQIPET